jgi:hypothetical protein
MAISVSILILSQLKFYYLCYTINWPQGLGMADLLHHSLLLESCAAVTLPCEEELSTPAPLERLPLVAPCTPLPVTPSTGSKPVLAEDI